MVKEASRAGRAPLLTRIDWTVAAALAVIVAAFVFQAVSLDFTQDDAFISFRYVKNLIQGRGLVFNPGERVEGYTNFLWIMLLAIFAGFGRDPVIISKILGVAAGGLSIVVLYRMSVYYMTRGMTAIAPKARGEAHRIGSGGMTQGAIRLAALGPPLLLASNGAFAYWSISGLETPLFVLGVLATVYFCLSDTRLAVVSAAATSLVRPEGILVFACCMLYSLITRRESLRRLALNVSGFVLLTLPFLVFRLTYYGDLLPNPFYAKTGLSTEYVQAGLAYFGAFLRHYGLMGLLYIPPVLLWRRLRKEGKFLLILSCVYSLYVILVGGDVLRGHRFFLPVVPLLYLLFVFSTGVIAGGRRHGTGGTLVWIAVILAVAFATFALPRESLLQARRYELGLNAKMTKYGTKLRESFGTDFTLAVPTIGVISYLTDARVIDMLGLTDPYIAKHPEEIAGLTSTWKERKFNAGYLLSQDPDFIMFSTGYKPSALAEKALFLHSRFRRNYYLYFFRDSEARPPTNLHVYRRKGPFVGTDTVYPNPAFVDLYAQAVYLFANKQDFDAACHKMREMLRVMPEDFARGYELLATCYFCQGAIDSAKVYASRAVAVDDYATEAHTVLHNLYLREGDREAAASHARAILKYNPEVTLRNPYQ
jgi:tetratricopeptide (TPR) repeat protein